MADAACRRPAMPARVGSGKFGTIVSGRRGPGPASRPRSVAFGRLLPLRPFAAATCRDVPPATTSYPRRQQVDGAALSHLWIHVGLTARRSPKLAGPLGRIDPCTGAGTRLESPAAKNVLHLSREDIAS